jgi:hypothetical protein
VEVGVSLKERLIGRMKASAASKAAEGARAEAAAAIARQRVASAHIDLTEREAEDEQACS